MEPGEGFLNDHWITLSEALAIATDYADPPGQTNSMWYQAARRSAPGGPAGAGGNFRPVLDHGRLVIDDWVPYIDGNTNGRWDTGEEQIGLGIPLALNVLDEFAPFGSEDTVTGLAGLINIKYRASRSVAGVADAYASS